MGVVSIPLAILKWSIYLTITLLNSNKGDKNNCIGNIVIFRIHSKPINIQWIRTGSHSYEKTSLAIVIYIQFSTNLQMYNYKIKTCF